MESYSFWQDFFDTYQSLSDWMKFAWLVVPPGFPHSLSANRTGYNRRLTASGAGESGCIALSRRLCWHILPTRRLAMVTRNVVLTDAQDELVRALVASGRFQNASEALRAGLRLLEEQEAGLAEIRDGLKQGLVQAETGDLAGGTGSEAIARAFARARTGS